MIAIENVNIRLGEFDLREINLSIEKNEFFILMGPTGAGKTVLLEAIAGLIRVDTGRIVVGGRDVTALPPENRGISIVYQDYSLFPHLTVRENITYGLHCHKIPKNEADKRFDRLMDELDLAHLLHRLPTNLSGGENQRVALARALIVSPQVLLLDEPLSALDPGFREELRKGLKKLHQHGIDVTFLMVTHDFSEALFLGDRPSWTGAIAVTKMKEIFQKPESTFKKRLRRDEKTSLRPVFDTRAAIDGLEVELGRSPDNGHVHKDPPLEDVVLSRKLHSSMEKFL